MAKRIGSAAKSSSRRCFTFVNVTTPTAPRTPLPTKFAVAEKHKGMLAPLAALHLWAQKAKHFYGAAKKVSEESEHWYKEWLRSCSTDRPEGDSGGKPRYIRV